MKRIVLVLLAAGVLFSAAGEAFAHHSFAATYDPDKRIKIEGTVKEFIWRNPHSFIRIEAPDETEPCRFGPPNGPRPRSCPNRT